jgi:condensin complex subunit 1
VSVGSAKKKEKDEELDQVVGSVEDDIGDQIQFVRERELMFDPQSILSICGPMVAFVCANNTAFPVSILFV